MGPPSLLITFDPDSWLITEVLPIASSDREEALLLEMERRIREALKEYREEACG